MLPFLSFLFLLFLLGLIFLGAFWDVALDWLLVEDNRPDDVLPVGIIAVIAVVEILHRAGDGVGHGRGDAGPGGRQGAQGVQAMAGNLAVGDVLDRLAVFGILLELLEILPASLALFLFQFLCFSLVTLGFLRVDGHVVAALLGHEVDSLGYLLESPAAYGERRSTTAICRAVKDGRDGEVDNVTDEWKAARRRRK